MDKVGKLNLVRNQRRRESDFAIEEGENDDSDFNNYDASEREVWNSTKIKAEHELQIHTYGQINSGETNPTELENDIMESNIENNQSVRQRSEPVDNQFGGVIYTKNF